RVEHPDTVTLRCTAREAAGDADGVLRRPADHLCTAATRPHRRDHRYHRYLRIQPDDWRATARCRRSFHPDHVALERKPAHPRSVLRCPRSGIIRPARSDQDRVERGSVADDASFDDANSHRYEPLRHSVERGHWWL